MPEDLTNKISIPFPDEPGAIWVTQTEYAQLLERLGEACVFHLCEQLERYAEDQPRKFAAYKNHARVILTWHQRKLSDGYDFFEHPEHGPGYYRQWVIAKLTGSSEGR